MLPQLPLPPATIPPKALSLKNKAFSLPAEPLRLPSPETIIRHRTGWMPPVPALLPTWTTPTPSIRFLPMVTATPSSSCTDTARPAPVGRLLRTAAKAGATSSFARATAYSWWTSLAAVPPVPRNLSSTIPAMWTATSSRWVNRPGTRISALGEWLHSATKAPSSRKGRTRRKSSSAR